MIDTKIIIIKYNDDIETIVKDVVDYRYCNGKYIVTIYDKSKSTPIFTLLKRRLFTNVYCIIDCQSELEWHQQQIEKLQREINEHTNELKTIK